MTAEERLEAPIHHIEPEPEREPEPGRSRSRRQRHRRRPRRSPPVEVEQPTRQFSLEEVEAATAPPKAPAEPDAPGAARGAAGRGRRPRRRRARRRGRARGDAGVPAGDARARPALVRAEASARLRLLVAKRLTWLDVFTSRPLTGNGLAVVHHADGIDDATMLAFARETKLSETTFVQTATEPGADYRNRIWTIVERAAVRRAPVARHRGRGRARARGARGALRAADGRRPAGGGRRARAQRRRARVDAPGAGGLRRRDRARAGLRGARPRRLRRAPRAAAPGRLDRAGPPDDPRARRRRPAAARGPTTRCSTRS